MPKKVRVRRQFDEGVSEELTLIVDAPTPEAAKAKVEQLLAGAKPVVLTVTEDV